MPVLLVPAYLVYNMTKYYDIRDVVTLLGLKTKKCGTGSQANVVCPVCGKLKLNINFDKNVFNCPVCDTHGNSNSLYTLYTGVEKPFKEICEKLNISDSTPVNLRPVCKPEYKEPLIRDIKGRDEVYSALVNMLKLKNEHKADLLRRGLPESYIDARNYVSVPKGQGKVCASLLERLGMKLNNVPGFYRDKDGTYNMVDFYEGYFIPIRDFNNRIQSFQIRNMNGDKNRKYIHFSSSTQNEGVPAKTYVHFACDFIDSTPILGKEIVLTEGPLKADIAHYASGVPFIAVPGVNSLSELEKILPILKEYGVEKISTAYDMDYIDKPEVKRAEEKMFFMIKEAGFLISKLMWDSNYKGIDDFLMAKKR